jgi:hypothetical protein
MDRHGGTAGGRPVADVAGQDAYFALVHEVHHFEGEEGEGLLHEVLYQGPPAPDDERIARFDRTQIIPRHGVALVEPALGAKSSRKPRVTTPLAKAAVEPSLPPWRPYAVRRDTPGRPG